ncbi:PREDICTED: C4b-binding protein beta chain-like [Priapulus caudatus]|uniref:C4b-binding protein beta chain-like n=1 Tax=Priapulus caudatus TaxID=37621 RepID=A0ABM1FAN1_PRICU|nr:PREDICTED: C4b-binding protein beta chain-like [Priapulus caudatus]
MGDEWRSRRRLAGSPYFARQYYGSISVRPSKRPRGKRPRSRCPRPSISNGRVKIRGRGRIARFRCRKRFYLIGSQYISCITRKWSQPPPVCASPRCEAPPTPRFAVVMRHYEGAMLEYRCQPGSNLTGAAVLVCDGSSWNGTAPTCEEAFPDASYNCSFEQGYCGWTHGLFDDFQWQRIQHSAPSKPVGTGPSFDHTLGVDQSGLLRGTWSE